MIRRLWPFAILILMPRMFNADMGFALCFVVRMSLWGTPSIPRDSRAPWRQDATLSDIEAYRLTIAQYPGAILDVSFLPRSKEMMKSLLKTNGLLKRARNDGLGLLLDSIFSAIFRREWTRSRYILAPPLVRKMPPGHSLHSWISGTKAC
jgi:hypothetical protein